MWRVFFIWCFSVVIAAAEQSVHEAQTFVWGEAEREYFLHVPEDIPDGAPLVVALHGLGGNAEKLRYGLGLNERADAQGFAALYPQGVRLRQGSRHWNAGFGFSDTDDLGFLNGLIANLRRSHDLGPVYVFGISNGAYMAYHMACHGAENVQAIASVVGTISRSDWNACAPSGGIDLLHIRGENDFIIQRGGIEHWASGATDIPSEAQLVAHWAALQAAHPIPPEVSIPGTNIKEYQSDENGARLRVITLSGFGHDWPHLKNSGVSAVDVIVDFFLERGASH